MAGFGEVVRDARLELGMTREALATASGLRKIHVTSLERGTRRPTLESIRNLACGLETTPDELMGKVEAKNKAGTDTSADTSVEPTPTPAEIAELRDDTRREPNHSGGMRSDGDGNAPLRTTRKIERVVDLGAAFGEIVITARLKRGWSQYDLQKISGLHQTHISAYERGIRSPLLEQVVKLANAFETTPAEFVSRLPTHEVDRVWANVDANRRQRRPGKSTRDH
jgi:transcriptional regulator with XRE-family HTH domain